MARCEFADGIINVRGTLSKSSYEHKGKKYTTRVVAQVTSSGKQRIYLRRSVERSSPVTEREQAARLRFKAVSDQVNAMSREEKQRYAQEMHDAQMLFNGKKYCSLRGYIMARLYAQIGDSIKPA
jgi:signal transduction histidine kinase